MKKYVILGMIALVMLLVAPAMAVGNDVNVNVAGDLPPVLSLNIDKDCSFATPMVLGDQYSSTATATVVSNVKYAVSAEATDGNYMKDGAKVLSKPFKLWDGAAGSPSVFSELDYSAWDAGNTVGTFTRTIQFSQELTTADLAGSYKTIVLFTAYEP